MLGLDHDTDPLGLQLGLEPVGDLFGEAFLDLGAAGEVLQYAGELRQAQEPVPGEVADVGGTYERPSYPSSLGNVVRSNGRG